MTDTNTTHDLPRAAPKPAEAGCSPDLFDTTTKAKKRDSWSTPKKHWALVKSRLLRFLFCVDDSMLEQIEEESALRDAFREEMTVHTTGSGVDSIVTGIKEIYVNTGYDMSNLSLEDISKTTISSECQTEIVFGDLPPVSVEGVVSLQSTSMCPSDETVKIVPKFVARLVLCLRGKFGRLHITEANRLLIEREYLKVCRDAKVRNVDIEYHRQFVVNTFFNESITDELATTRTRLPKWLREAFCPVQSVEPTIC